MNTQLNDSDDKGGRGKYIIPVGETAKHYNAMLLQALTQTKSQAFQALKHTQAAKENLRRRENTFQSWFAEKAVAPREVSPATDYQQHLAMVEQTATTILPPMPASLQRTDAIDISLEPTRIQANWNPHDLLAEMIQEERSPVTERHPRTTKQLSVPLSGPLDVQPAHHNYYESNTCALRTLITTGVDLYIRDRRCIPSLIEISLAARSLLPVIADWEEGYPYQAKLIPIVGNPQLEASAVRCWGN